MLHHCTAKRYTFNAKQCFTLRIVQHKMTCVSTESIFLQHKTQGNTLQLQWKITNVRVGDRTANLTSKGLKPRTQKFTTLNV